MEEKLTVKQRKYQKIQSGIEPKRPLLKNCIMAFLFGGLFCIVGQLISYLFMFHYNFTEQTVGNCTVATMVFISMLLTGFGVYDKIAQVAGAGSAVPVTGFGNAVISACIDSRSEGFVAGVGGGMFKLAGAVILFGVFSSFVVALIKTLFIEFGGL